MTLIPDPPAATKQGTSTARVVDKLPPQLRAIRSLACKKFLRFFSDLLFHILHEPPSRVASAQLALRREKRNIEIVCRQNFARSGRTDQGAAEPHGAHIPNSGLPSRTSG